MKKEKDNIVKYSQFDTSIPVIAEPKNTLIKNPEAKMHISIIGICFSLMLYNIFKIKYV